MLKVTTRNTSKQIKHQSTNIIS